MRPSFFLSSLSLLINIVPHKLKVLHDNVVNAIDTIIGGGLGLHLVVGASNVIQFNSIESGWLVVRAGLAS